MPAGQMGAHEARHCPARTEARPPEERNGRLVRCERAACEVLFRRSRYNKRQKFCSAGCGIVERNDKARAREGKRKEAVDKRAAARSVQHVKSGARGGLSQEQRDVLEMEPLKEQEAFLLSLGEATAAAVLASRWPYPGMLELMGVAA